VISITVPLIETDRVVAAPSTVTVAAEPSGSKKLGCPDVDLVLPDITLFCAAVRP